MPERPMPTDEQVAPGSVTAELGPLGKDVRGGTGSPANPLAVF